MLRDENTGFWGLFQPKNLLKQFMKSTYGSKTDLPNFIGYLEV